jgi:hypothetical protein
VRPAELAHQAGGSYSDGKPVFTHDEKRAIGKENVFSDEEPG